MRACKLVLFTLLVFLTACQALPPFFKEPRVTLSSLSMRPSQNGSFALSVVMAIENPNHYDIELDHVTYSLSLETYEVATGTQQGLQRLPAGQKVEMSLPITINVLNGLALMAEVMQAPRREIGYLLVVDTALTRPLKRALHIERQSHIQLLQ